MHMPTDTSALIERVVLAPSCSYPLRRAVLDVTGCFGLRLDLVKEATFDTAPYDKTVFEP